MIVYPQVWLEVPFSFPQFFAHAYLKDCSSLFYTPEGPLGATDRLSTQAHQDGWVDDAEEDNAIEANAVINLTFSKQISFFMVEFCSSILWSF